MNTFHRSKMSPRSCGVKETSVADYLTGVGVYVHVQPSLTVPASNLLTNDLPSGEMLPIFPMASIIASGTGRTSEVATDFAASFSQVEPQDAAALFGSRGTPAAG